MANTPHRCSQEAMDEAASNGHFAIVDFLFNKADLFWSKSAMDMAAANGHLVMVEYLDEGGIEGCTSNAMTDAASNGHLGIVVYLDRNVHRVPWKDEALEEAAGNGHLAVVKYLVERRVCMITDKAIFWATKRGHTGVLAYLMAKKYIFSTPTQTNYWHTVLPQVTVARQEATVPDWIQDYSFSDSDDGQYI
ncbi:hypothetical protein Ae201684_016031 [Aphanomyces euteiches]|nr:hypothetical protein Ae201684_016031 [Aphanomyces euteiches]